MPVLWLCRVKTHLPGTYVEPSSSVEWIFEPKVLEFAEE